VKTSEGKQSERILGIIPNYRAVSADTTLPPLSVKGKFGLATRDSFDYSSVLVAGVMAEIAQARDSYPEFHQGAAGFGSLLSSTRTYLDQNWTEVGQPGRAGWVLQHP
jgi:hypothetical protein